MQGATGKLPQEPALQALFPQVTSILTTAVPQPVLWFLQFGIHQPLVQSMLEEQDGVQGPCVTQLRLAPPQPVELV